ncbi:hypothetical protein CORC01_01194 [Colletotrichum orchidophilum]|uniref:BZIP domain-containing protein n=1 Tax=Colletotrichum orchidophilum TaxID=1209926 RepID=A0A1G4BQ72_9PEZI|nr:uncharacterized protein CORC01_01194 [Colletotrichum orchidophilum]OHF03475.1 hypothetical protein CORC01_01194 [Colletotrichum orchidophilum]
MMARSAYPGFLPMYAMPPQTLLSPINECHQCQLWTGCDCYTAELAVPPGTPASSLASVHREVEIRGRQLFDTTAPTTSDFITTTWAPQCGAWSAYQHLDFQPPESVVYNPTHPWPNPVDNPPTLGQNWLYTPDVELQAEPAPERATTSKTTRMANDRKPESMSQPPMKKARLRARAQASPLSTTLSDGNAKCIENANERRDSDRDTCSSTRPEEKKTYRVKNRAAAKRCREKTKQHEMDLAAQEKRVTQERMYLDACVTALKNEVLVLRSQILEHGGCDCEMIRGYIARTANNVSIGLHGECQLV